MPILFKSVLLTLTIAVFGIVIHHVTDSTSTDSILMASTLPDVTPNQSFRLSSDNDPQASVQPLKDHFLQLKDHLTKSCAAAGAMPGYTAILELQEEVDGRLRPVDRIEFKARREPFSVYMRWTDSQQEALYVHGENDNRLIVKPTKGLAAIRRVWRLDPNSRMAKQTCRYPITDVGIENLTTRVQAFYEEPTVLSTLADCSVEQATFSEKEVVVFHITFKDESSGPDYSASKFCFDKQSKLLIAVDNYGWSTDGQPRLIEHYFYDQIQPLPTPNDNDFTEDNPEYHFVIR